MEDNHKRVLRIAQNGLVACMGLIRNQGFMKALAPTGHTEVKF